MKRWWLVPSLVWLVFLCAVIRSAGSVERWMVRRWDGDLYVSIAERGFEIHRCGNPPIWCGNPWFPGWPYVNEAVWVGLGLRALRVPINTVFMVLGAAAFLALLLLVFSYSAAFMREPARWRVDETRLGVWACLGLVCQPGGFYCLTQFPYAFVLITALLFVTLTRAPALLACPPTAASPLAVFVGFACTLSYPSSFLFAVYPFAQFIYDKRFFDVRSWLKLAGWGAVFLSGTFLVCLIFRFKFGMFWLYFINHNQYAHDTPIVSTLSVVTDLIRNAGENERLTFLWYAFGLTLVGLRVPRVHREPSFWFVVLMLVFFPANGTWVGLYRYYVLGLPLFVLLGAAECAGWLKGAYLVVGILLQFGVLYPKYIAGHLI